MDTTQEKYFYLYCQALNKEGTPVLTQSCFNGLLMKPQTPELKKKGNYYAQSKPKTIEELQELETPTEIFQVIQGSIDQEKLVEDIFSENTNVEDVLIYSLVIPKEDENTDKYLRIFRVNKNREQSTLVDEADTEPIENLALNVKEHFETLQTFIPVVADHNRSFLEIPQPLASYLTNARESVDFALVLFLAGVINRKAQKLAELEKAEVAESPKNPVTEILEDAGLLSETDLLPRPQRHFKDNSLLGKAIFDPNNTLDDNLNLQLIGFPGNKILVGEDRRNKEPIYNTVTIQFDRDTLNEEWIKTKKSPLNDKQARVFDTIASIVCCQAGVSLDDPLIDTLKLIKTAPWKFNVTTAIKMLYQTDKPKTKQIEEFKDAFKLFISHDYTIDTTHQNRVYIENALDKYYKENKLDRSSYNATLSEMFSAFDRVRDTKPFIRGWLREIDNPNGTITRICYIDEIPFLPNLLLTKQFSTYDSAIYQIPENTRITNPNFYTLQGELARRIAEAGKLINSGNIKLLESGKKQYLFSLDIEKFLSDHAIEFEGKNPRRIKSKLFNDVIKAIRSNRDNFPHFENLFLYPAKEGVKKTHIVMGYIGKNGHRICKDKYLQAKKDDAETTRRRAKRKAKKEEEKAKKAAEQEKKL